MATKRQTAKALEGSIEKWRAIVEKRGVDVGTSNCPLCELFYHDSKCDGCPVQEATGEHGCNAPPYLGWSDHNRAKHPELIKKIHCPTCTRLAKAELKFLEGLRDG